MSQGSISTLWSNCIKLEISFHPRKWCIFLGDYIVAAFSPHSFRLQWRHLRCCSQSNSHCNSVVPTSLDSLVFSKLAFFNSRLSFIMHSFRPEETSVCSWRQVCARTFALSRRSSFVHTANDWQSWKYIIATMRVKRITAHRREVFIGFYLNRGMKVASSTWLDSIKHEPWMKRWWFPQRWFWASRCYSRPSWGVLPKIFWMVSSAPFVTRYLRSHVTCGSVRRHY